jgi:uncharacterized membrane protein YsdA (DUF1294 family)
MKTILLLWVLVWNLIAFLLMGVDKRKARTDAWRIPEKTLFLSAVLGGSVGAMLGMSFFRHKTKHWSFRLGMPAILVVQVAAALFFTWQAAF